MAWSFESDRPVYVQLAERLRKKIISGEYGAGEQIPSVRQLAAETAVNPNTVQRAYMELERQGFLYSVRGRGSFVSSSAGMLQDKKREELTDELRALLKEAQEVGIDPERLLLEAGWPLPE